MTKLSPISSKPKPSFDPGKPTSSKKPMTSRRKKLTKTRPKPRSTPKLSKIHDTSSDEYDVSGTTSRTATDEGFGSNGSGSSSGLRKSGSKRGKAVSFQDVTEQRINELIKEIVDHSICEIRHEEKHMSLVR